ncbi:unnamed protein product [Caenorhabditis auriculariae]|uniref:Retrotransposon gag domain-containing protein n=1 Tax=Caenorhabditis auriculariae TaxID=2777116 RepID=A0A8S1HV55_9PELO|nr:unnamed protein product [Caenorhabditis auriculariae]
MLTGELRELYETIPKTARADWNDLTSAFKTAYHTQTRTQEALAALSAASQNSQSVDEFSRKIRELSIGSYPSNTAARDASALAAFLAGLDPKLRRKVRRREPTSFDDAVTKAKKEESLQKLEERESALSAAVNATVQASVNAVLNERRFQPQECHEEDLLHISTTFF